MISLISIFFSSFSDDDMDYLPYIGLEDFSGKALKNTLAACAAELIGTMFLNLVGCGSALNNGGTSSNKRPVYL